MNDFELINVASMCIGCKNDNCKKGCNSSNPIKEAIALIKMGKIDSAVELWEKSMPLGIVCGKLCDHERGCLGSCNKKDNPVMIPEVCYELSRRAVLNSNYVCSTNKKIKIAIIGGGVAGLTFAYKAIKQGIKCDIYDYEDKLGGVLTKSIPDFRYDSTLFNLFLDKLFKMGLTYHKKLIDNDLFTKLYNDYDYVVVSVGCEKGKQIYPSLSYDSLSILKEARLQRLKINEQDIIISGAGNVAIDTARVLKRMGKNVTIVYRRNIANSNACKKEIEEALASGVKIKEYLQPYDVIKDDNIIKLKCKKTKLVPSDSGRMDFIVTDEEEVVTGEYLIESIGSYPDLSFLKGFINLNKYGYPDNMINGKIMVIGDAILGPSNFSRAIASAITCFQSILKDLN